MTAAAAAAELAAAALFLSNSAHDLGTTRTGGGGDVGAGSEDASTTATSGTMTSASAMASLLISEAGGDFCCEGLRLLSVVMTGLIGITGTIGLVSDLLCVCTVVELAADDAGTLEAGVSGFVYSDSEGAIEVLGVSMLDAPPSGCATAG